MHCNLRARIVQMFDKTVLLVLDSVRLFHINHRISSADVARALQDAFPFNISNYMQITR